MAMIAARFQEGLYARIVESLTEDVIGVAMERSSGCVLQKTKEASACSAENVFEESIFEAFRVAWNGVVENKEKLTEKWNEQIETGTPLQRLRVRQMKMMVVDEPIRSVVPEHVILVLERMVVFDKKHFEVRFLDGTVKQICLSE